MGLGNTDVLDDGDKGGGKLAAAISCSICLEEVMDNGIRSMAKLQCGHQFHLDCIGSAFNSKGAMQCPNCRKVEKGQWLYANGSRPSHEFVMDDWAHDDDLYDLSYSEMSFGVHWCPFSGLTRLPSSFDEGEFSSNAYHELLGHHAILAEHAPVSIAYIGPIHPSSSTSHRSVSDGSSFNNHWSGSSEVPSTYAFPSMDVNYQSWDHSSLFAANSRINGADQSSIPSVTQRTARNTSDMPRPGMHPYIFGHSSASRGPSSVTSSLLPPYPGMIARSRDHGPSAQPYFQQSTSNPSAHLSGGRRSSSQRGFAPATSSSDQPSGFYFFSSGSSGRVFQETENPLRDRFHVREREHQPTFPGQVDSIWSPIRPPTPGSDNLFRSNGYRQRHGSERMSSHNR